MDDYRETSKMSDPAEPAADLGILLTLSLRGFTSDLHSELAARGFAELRPAFGVVFRALRDEPLTLTDLANRLGVSKQAASKVVDEMVAKRLVRRRVAPSDARTKPLELTARGRRAMATAIDIGGEIDARLRATVGTGAVDSMHAVLEALVELTGLKNDLDRRRSPALWEPT
jgi:DNA-binding MarR family transcriptional regulator